MMACPVCFGGDEPALRDGLIAGMGVLVSVTLVVVGGCVGFAARIAFRSLRDHTAGDTVPGVAGRIGLHVVSGRVDD